jgi:KDO2-lipid IV(A) lauroyltransferase
MTWFLKGFTIPFKILPERLAIKLGESLGLLLYYFWHSRRKIALEAADETSKIIPLNTTDTTKLVREMFKNLGRYFAELLRLYWGDEGIFKKIRFKGLENFYKAKEEGKGIIFLTGHCGNWELMAIAFGRFIEPIGVVARPLNSRAINKFIEDIRTKYGNHVIYKKGAVKEILRDLRENRAVGILMDQSVLKEEGVVIDFLGRPAWTSRMPALIAKKTGARILPAFIRKEGEYHVVEIGEEIELTGKESEDTKRLSSSIEGYIIANPSEWLWIHRRWKRRE